MFTLHMHNDQGEAQDWTAAIPGHTGAKQSCN